MERGVLRRYTDILAVLDILWHRHLVLLSPKLWDDKNDSFYIEEYARRTANSVVMALCLTAENETYHHWRVFAGTAGACIVLRKHAFMKHVKECGLVCRPVIYRTIPQMEQKIRSDNVEDLPFLKRYPFRHEKEYRVLYGSIFADQISQDLPLPLELIDRIVLSPWTPVPLYVTLKEIVRTIPGCEAMRVHRSLLTDNERWKDALYRGPDG